jgi:sugar lactone lactonase YvrE
VKHRRSLIAGILAASLSCGACSSLGQQSVPALGSVPQASRSGGDQGPYLYVGGFELSQYALGSAKALHTVTPDYEVYAIALDDRGNLFALENYGSYNAEIQVYTASDLKLVRTIGYSEFLSSIATDSQGYMYVSMLGGIRVYTPGGEHLVFRIPHSPDGPMAFDASGDLYAGGQRFVAVYAPTKVGGHMKLLREIRHGVDSPSVVAFGPKDELFVANWSDYDPPRGRTFVSVVPAGGSKPARRIVSGLSEPQSLAVDSKGRLYVANTTLYGAYPFRSWVTVYAPDGTQPLRRLARGKRNVAQLAVDGSNNVYIANGRRVDVYAPGGTKHLYTITDGIKFTDSIALGSP